MMQKSSGNLRSVFSNLKIRSPSAMKSPRGSSSRDPDATTDRDPSEYETQEGEESGVRYVTESLIHKLSKQENLSSVKSLNLSLSKDGGKKFKFIENLEKCERLEELNLSWNLIEKVEKLQRQTRLRELSLAHNRISKIEGVEHMQRLQRLDLSANRIEHIPAWMGKKMKALRSLNLQHNNISSLQDISRLKPLTDLTSLLLTGNPVAALPHYRLFAIFHLRALSSLDGRMITEQERREAADRFHLEEVEKLERDLEKREKELEELQEQKAKVLSERHLQDQLNKSLRHETQQQKKRYKELEQEMDTKNEILRQKTLELSRACRQQYEQEQELAFYKIDAKFQPLGYLSPEEVDAEEAPGESPYIGKARYKRNLCAQEGNVPDRAQRVQVGRIELDPDDRIQNQQIRARIHTSLEVDLKEKEQSIRAAESRLTDLRQEIVTAAAELRELQEAADQRKVSEAEKEGLRRQLSGRIRLLDNLRAEALELEQQMERQRRHMEQKQQEIDELQRHLRPLSPQDPRHSHVNAQKISKERQLEMMDGQYRQLEGRLDGMLCRIARETEEIRDLEQQLTEGQIAANEALKRDLEGIISGLQEYLESVKAQARQAQDECRELRSERGLLLQRLDELEAAAQEAERRRKEMEELERSLQEQQDENASLQRAQGDLRANAAEMEAQVRAREAEMEAQVRAREAEMEAQVRAREAEMEAQVRAREAEMEAQVRARETEIAQMRQELEQQQAQNSAWRDEWESERRALNRSLQEQDSSKLQQLQEENESLKLQTRDLRAQLRDAADNLVPPEQISARVSELKRKLQTGVGDVRSSGPSDVLGQNLADLQQQMNQILAKSEEEKSAARERQRRLQEEVAALQERIRGAPEEYKRACNKAAEARIQTEKRQNQAQVRRLETEVRQLHEKLRTTEEIQGLADQQLLEAEEERERLQAELHDLEVERKMEASRAQEELCVLERELKELRRTVVNSDNLAASELTDTKDQLRSLHSTVHQIHRERAEEMREAENYCSQATRAARELLKAEAEIELLQDLLQDKEKQLQDELQNAESGRGASNSQQLEIERLNRALRRQRTEMERLRHLLEHAGADNSGEIEHLMDEIESLRRALGCQSDYITSMADPFRRKGYWYYLPAANNSPRDSLSTKDSGVSSPMTSSPAKRRSCHHPHGRQGAPTAAGHWVYSPLRPGGTCCQGDGDAELPPSCHFVPPPGSVIYTLFPDGAPAPQGSVIYGPPPPSEGRAPAPGTVIYGPPPVGTPVVYGPPPPQFTIPVIPAGVLHCNVSAHHDLEDELRRLGDVIDHLKCRQRKEKKLKATLKGNVSVLENQRDALRTEVEELRGSFVSGHLERTELEGSRQHQENIEDEIDCMEKTLLKRRAELREAERLLAEAESDVRGARDKTVDLVEKYNAAKKHLCQAESDAEELERRAQDTARNLVKADQQLRMLQADARDLEQHRAAQESVLQGITSVVVAKDAEFQSLNHKIEAASASLQKLQEEIQTSERKKDEHQRSLKEAENLVSEKRSALQQLHGQVSARQEEAAKLEKILGLKQQELHLLQSQIEQKKVAVENVLRESERELQEVKSVLENLSVEKGEASGELSERRAQLSALREEIREEEDNLQERLSQIHKQKCELKHVLEMQQFEDQELQGLKLQHEQKLGDLEKTQSLLLQGKLELETLQRTLPRVHGEVERERRVLARDHQEVALLTTQLEALSSQKADLQEQNQELQQRLLQSKQALSDTEERSRTASAALEELEADIRSLRSERSRLNKQKQVVQQETAAAQQILEERTEDLKGEVAERREQLRLLEQDLRSATQQRDERLQEKAALQGDIADAAGRHKVLQETEERMEERLRQLQRSGDETQRKVSQQEALLMQIVEEIEGRKEQLRAAAAAREVDRKNYERDVAERRDTLAAIARSVRAQEERALRLQQELDTTRRLLSEREEQLQGRSREVAALQEETETWRRDLRCLQEEAKTIDTLREAISEQRLQHEAAAEELKREISVLKKQLMTVEQAAHDNHEQEKRLLQELRQLQAEHRVLQAEHRALQEQLKSQEELDKRQQEVNEAVRELKAQVKLEIQSSLQELQSSAAAEEPALEQRQRGQDEQDSLTDDYPFSANPPPQENWAPSRSHLQDEQWRGEALREKLRQQDDRLKAQLHQQMSKQAAVLSRGRQQTEGSLHSLRRRLDALDDLVSAVAVASPLLSHNDAHSVLPPQGLKQRANLSPGLHLSELSALHPPWPVHVAGASANSN